MKIKINPGELLNNAIYFLMGFFLDSFYFLLCLKLLNGGGLILSILSTFAFNYFCFKKPGLSPTIRTVSKGAFTFNVLITLVIIVLGTISFSLIQGLIG